MKNKIILYHGASKEIKTPQIEKTKLLKDYGMGFYCADNYDLACEWAAKKEKSDTYVNKYILNTKMVRVLDLTDEKHNILNWVALVLKNRFFVLKNPLSLNIKDYINNNFYINLDFIDLIKGYRADNSNFLIIEDFLNNKISVEALDRIIRSDKNNIQYAFISEINNNKLSFKEAFKIERDLYIQKAKIRDLELLKKYNEECSLEKMKNEHFIIDILRGGLKDVDLFL